MSGYCPGGGGWVGARRRSVCAGKVINHSEAGESGERRYSGQGGVG